MYQPRRWWWHKTNHHGSGQKHKVRVLAGLSAPQHDTYEFYRTPCGFCFVEYYTHAEALASMRYVSGTKLDERIIRCDLDLGYKEGRQFGRGKSGGQVRDEHRQDYDPGRGGWGAQAQRMEIERRREVEERYADAQDGPGAVAGGGGDWKEAENAGTENKLKRGRSPDDDGDNLRLVRKPF